MFGLKDCPSCGKANSAEAAYCEFCGESIAHRSAPAQEPIAQAHNRQHVSVNQALGIASQTSAPQWVQPQGRAKQTMARYREGYTYARTINGLGIFIQIAACVVGGLLLLVGFIGCMSAAESNSFGSQFGIAGGASSTAIGLVVGIVGYIHGVIVRAAGQLLKAHFDCAVNGSPFLDDNQRAQAMSLE